jgi:hypothetical protein
MLPQFSTDPLPKFALQEASGVLHLELDDDAVGLQSAIGFARCFCERSTKIRGGFSLTTIPEKKSILNFLLHPDCVPPHGPRSEVFDTTVRGLVKYGDPKRQHDRLDMHTPVTDLGQGSSRFRCKEVPRYVDAVNFVCEKMKWDPTILRGFRCEIEYPMYGSQIFMVIEPNSGSGPRDAE